MNELGELSEDEVDLVTRFRKGSALDRARIILATHPPAEKSIEREMLELRSLAAYLECNEYGRARCLEAMEIFAAAPSVEEALARLAEIEAARPSATVVDISTFRP